MHPALQQFILDLGQLSPSDDDSGLAFQLHDLTASIENCEGALEVVPHILAFFERYPNAEHGTPGALVHFIETLYPAYVEHLVSSVERKPTPHTLWMVNRILNAKIEPALRHSLINLLEKSALHPLADNSARQEAAQFAKRHLENAG